MRQLEVGPFELLERVGEGAAGQVWHARHTPTEESVAVKLVEGEPGDPGFSDRFRDEVRAMATLDHPNVVAVYDYGAIETPARLSLPPGSMWMALELAEGTLGEQHLTWSVVRRVLEQLLDGLGAAHAEGIVHRDLKPANILRFRSQEDPIWKLADFGIASVRGMEAGRASLDESPRGTPGFMAPEQIMGQWRDHGPWTDMYALGCVAWALTTGDAPFTGNNIAAILHKQVLGQVPPYAPIVEVPDGFGEWLEILMARPPQARFARAGEAREALRALRLQDAGGADGGGKDRRWMTDHLASTVAWQGNLAEATWAGELPWDDSEQPDGPPPTPPRQKLPKEPPANLNFRSIPRGAGMALFGLRTPSIVGREEERQRLWASLRQCIDSGDTGVVVVRGPRGVGKTRLDQWLLQNAHALGGIDVLRAGEGDRRLARLVDNIMTTAGLSVHLATKRIQHQLKRIGVQDPALADALVAAARPAQFSVAHQDRLAAFTEVLPKLTGGRPALIWIDNAHLDGDGLMDWAADMLKRAPLAVPLFIGLTVVDEELDDELEAKLADLEAKGARVLSVEGLNDGEISFLLKQRVNLEPAAAARVVRHVGGNPQFAMEIVQGWIRAGEMELGQRGFRHASPDEPLPTNVEESLVLRYREVMEDATDEERKSLLIAAVLGSRVDETEWQRCCAGAGLKPAWTLLDQLFSHRLARVDDEGWTFANSAIRAEIRADGGPDLEALASRCADILAGEIGQVRAANLLIDGGRANEAERALFDALVLSTGSFSPVESLAISELWERLWNRLGRSHTHPDWGDGQRQRLMIQLNMGISPDTIGKMETLVVSARQHDWPCLPMALLNFAQGLLKLRRVQEATDVMEEALARSQDDRTRANILHTWSQLELEKGDPGQAMARAREALTLAEPGTVLYGMCAEALGRQQLLSGDIAGAIENLENSLRNLANWYQAGSLHQSLGMAYDRDGQTERAIACFHDALRMHRRLGSMVSEAHSWNDLAEISRRTGALDKADVYYRRALSVYRRSEQGVHPMMWGNIGLVELARGDLGEARRLIGKSLRLFEEGDNTGWAAICAALLLPAVVNDLEQFDAVAEKSTRYLAESQLADPDSYLCLAQAGRAMEVKGDVERALRAWSIAQSHSEILRIPHMEKEAEAAVSRLTKAI